MPIFQVVYKDPDRFIEEVGKPNAEISEEHIQELTRLLPEYLGLLVNTDTGEIVVQRPKRTIS